MNNFLVRSREDFAKHGFVVAVVDAPSDRQDGMYGFRNSAQHVTDIETVIAYLKKRFGLPVWLVGTSRGTDSAAYVAIHSKETIGGLVLTSSVTEKNEKGETVTSMALDYIRVPTLVVAHERDECRFTPPERAKEIAARLVHAPRVEVKYVKGGYADESKPCQGLSAHGFFGIESKVVAAIADFITSTSK
jgi:pimeloyl-ACP methyl ester carboxylesterase